MNKVNSFSKIKLITILLLSFTASFMFFIFAPLDIYFRNPPSFVIGWSLLLPWLLLFTLVGFVVLSSILILLWKRKLLYGVVIFLLCALLVTYARFVHDVFFFTYIYLYILIAVAVAAWVLLIKLLKEKAIDYILLLLLGCIIAAYVQLLFLNGNMVTLDTSVTNYSNLSLFNITNLIIWIVIALLPLALWIVSRKMNREIKTDKIFVFIISVILCMQIAEISTTAITTPLPAGFENNSLNLVHEPLLELSSDENIIVFLIDSLDVVIMEETLEKYPELYNQLYGFTFYRNNTPEFIKSFPAITTLLTQHYYEDNMTFIEYFEEAWSHHSFLDTLRENGYITNLYISAPSAFGDIAFLEGQANNIRADGYVSANIENILTLMSRLSAGRFAPYLMKDFFLATFSSDFGNKLFEFISYDYTPLSPLLGYGANLTFYEFINNNVMSTNDNHKIFNFVHLIGAHQSSMLAYDAANNTIFVNSEHDFVSTTRAAFEILNTYLNHLRNAGIYDNTTIFVISDHAHEANPHPFTPTALLIKPKGARGRLEINNDAELSNKHFGASVLEAAGIAHEHLGLSYFDIINGAPPLPRRLYVHTHWWLAVQDGTNRINTRQIYEVSGDANNPDNWRRVK